MITSAFEQISTLQLRLKASQNEVKDFKSGAKYVQMKNQYDTDIRRLEKRLRKRDRLIAGLRIRIIKNRDMWFEQIEIVEKEHAKEIQQLKKELNLMEKRALRAENALDDANNKLTEQRRELYSVKTELEEEKGKVKKLQAQINRDFETSSIPSSLSRKPKKISNSREKTGRKPGAQSGHPHHGRKKQTPTQPEIFLLPSDEIINDPDFKPTGKFLRKQLVGLKVLVTVQEYVAEIYRNTKTGETAHAEFPEGVSDDVNYDGSIKAFLFLLNNECCVSIDKSRRFLSDLTGGKLEISKGMINKLSRSFSEKTTQERQKIFSNLLLSPVIHTDNTNAKLNGKSHFVFVSASPDGLVLYQSRENKGHNGIKGTPVEDYFGILVHDHDKTFYNYGSNHQECLAHVLRYLKDSIVNEPELKWNGQMRTLLQEMIHFRNELSEGEIPDPARVADFEERYHEILQTAADEYTYEPPSDYYRDGYNLSQRMSKFAENHLLFLHNILVPTTNNLAERLLRCFKRKQKQAMSFRSDKNIEYLCDSMSVLFMMRQKDESNFFEQVAEIF